VSSTLGLGFALGRASGACGFDFGGAALPAGATLTRGSAGSIIDAAGAVRTVAADAPRFDHDPVSGARTGLLIEPAASNAIAHPHGFTVAPWTLDQGDDGSLPVTTPGQPAPDGTNGAVRVDFARGIGFSRLRNNVAVPAAGQYCFSLWLCAAAPGPSITLRLDGTDSGTLMLDTRWRRAAFTSAVGTIVDVQLILWSLIAGAPLTTSVFAWGAQLEPGASPTSFVEGSRAADVLTLDWGAKGVADGALAVRYRFDDDSWATGIQTVSGGRAVVPTDLPRAALRRIERA